MFMMGVLCTVCGAQVYLPYFIEISIWAFWGFRKRCTILMEMNVDIIQL